MGKIQIIKVYGTDWGMGQNGILFAILVGMMLSKFYKGEVDENMKLFKVDRFAKKIKYGKGPTSYINW